LWLYHYDLNHYFSSQSLAQLGGLLGGFDAARMRDACSGYLTLCSIIQKKKNKERKKDRDIHHTEEQEEGKKERQRDTSF